MLNKRQLKIEFQKQLPGILFNEKLAKYSTFNIGGPADFFYKLKSTEKLGCLIKFCNMYDLPYFIMGGGSNILFSDAGFRGLVIKIETNEIIVKSNKIIADAGVPVATLVNESIKNNLTGLEPWAGLPGTVGGAVRGNAGCNGLEVKDVLSSVFLIEPKSAKVKESVKKYFHFRYRYSKLKKTNEIVLRAVFKLKKKQISRQEQLEIIKNIRKNRVVKQPFGASCGSFFKNPSLDKPAGYLIDKAGLKGKIMGRAQISPKHANFFINPGNAKAKDILKLARLAQLKVKTKFGINLEPEVQIVDVNGISEL